MDPDLTAPIWTYSSGSTLFICMPRLVINVHVADDFSRRRFLMMFFVAGEELLALDIACFGINYTCNIIKIKSIIFKVFVNMLREL